MTYLNKFDEGTCHNMVDAIIMCIQSLRLQAQCSFRVNNSYFFQTCSYLGNTQKVLSTVVTLFTIQ